MKVSAFAAICASIAFGSIALAADKQKSSQGKERACSATAATLRSACVLDVGESAATMVAACLNLADENARNDCKTQTKVLALEARDECAELFSARKDVCEAVGEAPYEPEFGGEFAQHFVDPRDIGQSVQPNAYFPLLPGARREYRATFRDEDGELVQEDVVVTYSNDVKSIEGALCLRVHDVVEQDGEVVEDTEDWFAQDRTGNVWYCGEIAKNFETFEGDDPPGPELVDVDGSWKAGRELAKAGIVMPATPRVGMVVRQEVAWGIAEDVIEIADLEGSATVPAASCSDTCLVTRDFTALEPGVVESKYYAPGIGLILEVGAAGERLELIAHD